MQGAEPQPVVRDAGAERGMRILDPVPPVALVLLGATSIQFGAGIAVTLFDDLGPAGTSVLRLGLAAIILMTAWRPRIAGRTRADLLLAVAFGLALGGMNLCFYEALDRIPLGPAVTIEFIGPIALASLLSRRAVDFVWIALASAGIVLLAAPWSAVGGLDGVGIAFAAIAAVLWALYIVLAQRSGRVYQGGEGLALAMVVGALVPLVPGVLEAGTALLDPALLAAGLGVALLSSVIPYSLETEALRRMPARVFGLLMSLEPALAALAGLVILGQQLGVRDVAAIALVVAASVGVTRTAPPLGAESALDA